jgi:hypothetical protein
MARNRISWPRGSSAARSLVAGLVLLMSITGCAHLGKSPPSASTTGSTSRPPETADAPKGSAAREDAAALPSATSDTSHPAVNGSTQTGSAPATGAKHDQSPSAGASKNEADNTPVAAARSSTGGTAVGTKPPSPAKGGSASDKEPPGAAGNGPPTLGLTEIEQRLRDTHAIGVFTKLSLKNQIDDLLGQLRAYHLKQTNVSLPQLRQRYDVLLQKVIGLLQNGDAPLAKDISSSREAIWSLLTNSTTISRL